MLSTSSLFAAPLAVSFTTHSQLAAHNASRCSVILFVGENMTITNQHDTPGGGRFSDFAFENHFYKYVNIIFIGAYWSSHLLAFAALGFLINDELSAAVSGWIML